jgi:hypothetical protein
MTHVGSYKMPNDIEYLLQDYDDLVATITNSNNALYQQNLARLFSFLDETPAFARVVAALEALNDFDAWYRELEARQRNHGMGGAPLNFPANRDAALGTQITLFRRMGIGKIQAAIFAHVYIAPRERNINSSINQLSNQLFWPMSRSLRRRLERIETGFQDLQIPPLVPFAVPASDRTVSLDHNKSEYAEAIQALEKVEQAIKEANDYDDQDDKDQRIAEISAGRRLLQATKASALAIYAVVRSPLSYLMKKFADVTIGDVAKAALALIGRLTGLW